jgi:hypothetical protein
MRKIRIIGVLLVGILFSLGACASPATSNKFAQVPAEPGAKMVNAQAPAVVQTAAPVQSTAASPAPVAVPSAPIPVGVVAAVPVQAVTGTAGFKLSDLKITPNPVTPGNDVIVTVAVTNPGQQAGTDKFILNLVMDGEACPSFIPITQEVNLAGGASQVLTFKLSMGPGSSGSYTVTVGQLTGSLLVQ